MNECLADALLCSSGLSFLPKHPHTPGLQLPISEQTHLRLLMDTCPTLAKTEEKQPKAKVYVNCTEVDLGAEGQPGGDEVTRDSQGAIPGHERPWMLISPVLLCKDVGEHTLYPYLTQSLHQARLGCMNNTSCVNPKADSCTKYGAQENNFRPPSQQRHLPCL